MMACPRGTLPLVASAGRPAACRLAGQRGYTAGRRRHRSMPPEEILCGEGDELRWFFQSLGDEEGRQQCPHHVSSSILSSSLLSILYGGHQSECAVLLFVSCLVLLVCFRAHDCLVGLDVAVDTDGSGS